MRIELNDARCQGHLRCLALAPELFDCDEFGYATLRTTDVLTFGAQEAALRSEANCPERAIRLC